MMAANVKKSRHHFNTGRDDTMQSKSLNPNLTRDEDEKKNAHESIEKLSNLSSATEKKDMGL